MAGWSSWIGGVKSDLRYHSPAVWSTEMEEAPRGASEGVGEVDSHSADEVEVEAAHHG